MGNFVTMKETDTDMVYVDRLFMFTTIMIWTCNFELVGDFDRYFLRKI